MTTLDAEHGQGPPKRARSGEPGVWRLLVVGVVDGLVAQTVADVSLFVVDVDVGLRHGRGATRNPGVVRSLGTKWAFERPPYPPYVAAWWWWR